jgi:hypothetical protein
MIKINTSGDYVQLIYVDAIGESVQQEVKSDTDAFECSYDSDGKLYLQFGLMRFENPDPTDFTINGVAVTDAADFISKLDALFTGGGGATIYTGDGSLSGDRTVDLNGHDLTISDLSGNFKLYMASAEKNIYLQSSPDGDIISALTLNSDLAGDVDFLLYASDNSHNNVRITGNAKTSGIEYAADTHTFKLGTAPLAFHAQDTKVGSNSLLVISTNDGFENSSITSYSSEIADAYGRLSLKTNTDDGFHWNMEIKNGTNEVEIDANADANSITFTAAAFITPGVLPLDFADDAAAAIGGVAVGQWYHNSGALRIRRS